MLHLRRRKAEIYEDCETLKAKLRQFSSDIQEQLGPAISAEPAYGSNQFFLQAATQRGLDNPLNAALREARRAHTRIRHEFTILVDVSLASESADEYRKAHRPIAIALGGTPASNYDILLREIEHSIDQIEYFKMEVEAAEDVVPESEAQSIDVGVVIALKEEFEIFRSLIPITKTTRKNNRYYYEGRIAGPDNTERTCVATMIGEMGPTRAAVVTSEMLRFYRPIVVAMIGIAGSVSSDLLLGDVVVARGIDDYGASVKAVETDGGYEMQAGGLIFSPTKSIVELAKNFPFVYEKSYLSWQQQATEQLVASGISTVGRKVGSQPKLGVEVIASGAYLSASKSFNRFLREHRNREIKCIEMESSGLMNTIHQFSALKSLIVRGISDHADDEKAALESESANFFRRYAMQNAVTLFKSLTAVSDFWTD
jgi:nucleoside phosphorylase